MICAVVIQHSSTAPKVLCSFPRMSNKPFPRVKICTFCFPPEIAFTLAVWLQASPHLMITSFPWQPLWRNFAKTFPGASVTVALTFLPLFTILTSSKNSNTLAKVYSYLKLWWLVPWVLFNGSCNDFLNSFLRYLNEGREFITLWTTLIISHLRKNIGNPPDSSHRSCNCKLNRIYLWLAFFFFFLGGNPTNAKEINYQLHTLIQSKY